MLSYLPLAHSFERTWVEAASLVDGRLHLFFAESLDTFLQDLQRTQPTLFLSVPRLWLKFQQGVFAKMPPDKLDRLLGIPILGKIVAKKMRKGLGLDQVKLAGSGSAPIPPELIAWYRRIGLPLYEGYGMTEDSSYSHVSTEEHNAPGYVGVPLAGVQVKLSPEGEVLIKSPGQCIGYYKQPELTAESFTPDGFFRTGDLGERTPDGLLKLTGRAKELFKTAKGKYVAPAPIENRINAHPMVELSLVSGVGQPAAYAMVILAEHLRPRMHEAELREQVEKELHALLEAINAAVADHEQLHMIVVAREPWSIENGFLTPTMKVRRGPHREGDGAARRALVRDRSARALALRGAWSASPCRAARRRPRRRRAARPRRARSSSRCAAATSRRSSRRPRRAASASSTRATKRRPCSPPTRWRG